MQHYNNIAYQSEGNGQALVFLHGFGEDQTMWEDFTIPFIENYQVVTIDLPGFGQSEVSEISSIENYAAAVKQVLDHLEITTCIMIGHSMGGYTVLAFAEKYAKMLSGYCIFHSHPFADPPSRKENRNKGMSFLRKYGVAQFAKNLMPLLFSKSYLKNNRMVVNRLIEKASAYKMEGMIGGLEAMKNRPDRTAILAQSTVPVLFIVGKLDASVSFEQSMRMATLPNVSSFHILEEIGHMGMFSATETTQNILMEFVDFCSLT